MRSRSKLSLSEIRELMIDRPPDFEELRGGWASMSNHQTNLGIAGVKPPPSEPVIDAGTSELPEMLKARYYFWSGAPAALKRRSDYDPYSMRPLDAIDVVITKAGDGKIGMLFSSRSRQVLNRRDGAVAALNEILQTADATIKIDRERSHLELADTDIFLWLTVQQRDSPQIAPEIKLDTVSGISGRDASSRTAHLRAGVDFSRPNFLTAVAEADTLGPIEMSFVHYIDGTQRSYKIELHLDGGFRIRKNDVHFPNLVDTEELMLEATYSLAYSIIPRINQLYLDDAPNWQTRRLEVIESAMDDLEQRYRIARNALKERLEGSPEPLSGPEYSD